MIQYEEYISIQLNKIYDLAFGFLVIFPPLLRCLLPGVKPLPFGFGLAIFLEFFIRLE
jgi:hypothetical protein